MLKSSRKTKATILFKAIKNEETEVKGCIFFRFFLRSRGVGRCYQKSLVFFCCLIFLGLLILDGHIDVFLSRKKENLGRKQGVLFF